MEGSLPANAAGSAGCLLTFILCLGYYITPTLVGAPADQMLRYFVAYYTIEELNRGIASARGPILLIATLLLYSIFNKLVDVHPVKIGLERCLVLHMPLRWRKTDTICTV